MASQQLATHASPAPQLPRGLTAAFALSGFAALVNEVAAARWLAIPIGADAPAVAAVLSALLVGFAIGGFGAATLLARGAEARRTAIVLEAGLAFCALLSPLAFPALSPVVARGGDALGLESGAFLWFRFGAALLACLPPALLMGATFPVALRLARAHGLADLEASTAVYGPNTLGAALGAIACGFVILPLGGYLAAVVAACAASALAALLFMKSAHSSSAWDEAPAAPKASIPPQVLAATFLAGAAAFALEVLLTRCAITVFGASTYAFTSVLVAFLLGLALGAPLARRAGEGAAQAQRGLAIALAAAAALTVAGIYGFRLYLGLDDPFRASNRFPALPAPWLLPVYQGVVSSLLLLPPAAALGAAFPLAVAAARAHGASADRAAGLVYGFNTLGSLAGTLVATFVVLPQIGTRYGTAAAVVTLSTAAFLAALPRAGWTLAAAPLALLLLLTRSTPPEGITPKFFNEGMSSTVSVDDARGADGRDLRSISVNGTVVATQGLLDLRLQRLLGHLPALLHPEPARTLVIGLGSGVTAGSLATTPGVQSTRIVEMESFVVEAAKLFDSANRGVASGSLPGVKITILDGRTHLLATKERYEVVTCDPIHPWVAGAGNLYSRECFQQERAVMAPGGLAALWLPLYKLRTDDLRVVVRTWCDVFRSTSLYVTGYDAILLGADGPWPQVELERLRPRFEQVRPFLEEVEIRSVEELLSGFALDDAGLRAFAADAPANTDARPILEYRAPLLYLTDYAVEFLADVRRKSLDPAALFGARASIDPQVRARAADQRARAIEAFLGRLPASTRDAIAAASQVLREPR